MAYCCVVSNFTLLFALLILGIAVRFAKRWWIKGCLITVAALLTVLSEFYKATAKIMLVAIAIYLFLLVTRWIEEQVATQKKVFTKRNFGIFFKKSGAYVLLFLLVFSFGQKACFRFLDHYVGYTVNRNATPHYLFIGLFSENKGSWTPEYGGHFHELAVENQMNYEIATEHIMEELKEDIEKNKHLSPSMFFIKAKTAFEAENYMYFVTLTLNPDVQVVQANVINRWTSNINCYYVMIGILLTWAIYKLRDQESSILLISALYITGFVLSMLLLENQPRYKLVVFPFMCILAAYPFDFLPEKIFHKK